MHELGIVFYIIRDVKEVAEANKVSHINSVTMSIGTVSTIQPYYLVDCWHWAIKKEGKLFENTKLIVEPIDAITFCEDCKQEYDTVKYGKKCPYCGSEHTFLKTGNEVEIKEIEVG